MGAWEAFLASYCYVLFNSVIVRDVDWVWLLVAYLVEL
jgi:hypothetical protein